MLKNWSDPHVLLLLKPNTGEESQKIFENWNNPNLL